MEKYSKASTDEIYINIYTHKNNIYCSAYEYRIYQLTLCTFDAKKKSRKIPKCFYS